MQFFLSFHLFLVQITMFSFSPEVPVSLHVWESQAFMCADASFPSAPSLPLLVSPTSSDRSREPEKPQLFIKLLSLSHFGIFLRTKRQFKTFLKCLDLSFYLFSSWVSCEMRERRRRRKGQGFFSLELNSWHFFAAKRKKVKIKEPIGQLSFWLAGSCFMLSSDWLGGNRLAVVSRIEVPVFLLPVWPTFTGFCNINR